MARDVSVRLASYLRPLAGGHDAVPVPGDVATVGEALAAVWRAWPAVRDRVVDERGVVRQHVNVFVGREMVPRGAGGMAVTLGDAAEVWILPAVSGG